MSGSKRASIAGLEESQLLQPISFKTDRLPSSFWLTADPNAPQQVRESLNNIRMGSTGEGGWFRNFYISLNSEVGRLAPR
jgi:hypothetical protein